MAKKAEYQVGTMPFSNIEEGHLSKWFAERSDTGWKVKLIEQYHSKKYDEDALFWVLEREYESQK